LDWIALAVLGLIWAMLLLPEPRSSRSRSLKMPIEQEFRHPGRWILSPRRGSRFVGPHARQRERARERRRRVFVFLLEAIGLTGLIGVFPPLRGMLVVTALFALLLLVYAAMVLTMTRGAAPAVASNGHSRPSMNVVVLPEIQVRPDPLLEEQDRRLVRLAR
jgi:asparagine N-glycosylation enzyme membrane subunit Stt3